jgi:hypothetical protein
MEGAGARANEKFNLVRAQFESGRVFNQKAYPEEKNKSRTKADLL